MLRRLHAADHERHGYHAIPDVRVLGGDAASRDDAAGIERRLSGDHVLFECRPITGIVGDPRDDVDGAAARHRECHAHLWRKQREGVVRECAPVGTSMGRRKG